MKPEIHLIHGIHASEGDISTPEVLIPMLRVHGFPYHVHEYGYAFALLTRFQNPGRARDIAYKTRAGDQINQISYDDYLIQSGDILLGHSNGADVANRVAWLMNNQSRKLTGMVLLNPAMDRDAKFPPNIDWILVFHNEDDWPVLFSSWLPFRHPMGKMGRDGYQGDDPRVTNIDTKANYGASGHFKMYRDSISLRRGIAESIKTMLDG